MIQGLDFLNTNTQTISAVSFINDSVPFEEDNKEMLARRVYEQEDYRHRPTRAVWREARML